jgi:hypothetical protein
MSASRLGTFDPVQTSNLTQKSRQKSEAPVAQKYGK